MIPKFVIAETKSSATVLVTVQFQWGVFVVIQMQQNARQKRRIAQITYTILMQCTKLKVFFRADSGKIISCGCAKPLFAKKIVDALMLRNTK